MRLQEALVGRVYQVAVSDRGYIPVEVAFREEPSNIKPIRIATLLQFGVVSRNIRTSIVWQWSPKPRQLSSDSHSGMVAHVNLRLCCNSYFNVASPWVIFLPSSCFSGSVSTEVARWTSSIAPVCAVMRS